MRYKKNLSISQQENKEVDPRFTPNAHSSFPYPLESWPSLLTIKQSPFLPIPTSSHHSKKHRTNPTKMYNIRNHHDSPYYLNRNLGPGRNRYIGGAPNIFQRLGGLFGFNSSPRGQNIYGLGDIRPNFYDYDYGNTGNRLYGSSVQARFGGLEEYVSPAAMGRAQRRAMRAQREAARRRYEEYY
ncbi:hypothetical protein BDZ45DRAFT_759762 [Acephala macrosclerotiorum]|nr:hypothetical protein BDZ45DRAFT_759762 [Acephala macrosclerotiorum]